MNRPTPLLSSADLAGRLRIARSLSGKAARQIDILAGLADGHTAAIEAGRKKSIEAITAARLAQALNVSLDWLIAGIGLPPKRQAAASVAAVRKGSR